MPLLRTLEIVTDNPESKTFWSAWHVNLWEINACSVHGANVL